MIETEARPHLGLQTVTGRRARRAWRGDDLVSLCERWQRDETDDRRELTDDRVSFVAAIGDRFGAPQVRASRLLRFARARLRDFIESARHRPGSVGRLTTLAIVFSMLRRTIRGG